MQSKPKSVSNSLSERISFRRITDSDLGFLRDLYATTREAEMKLLTDWTSNQKRDFLAHQFNAQHKYYQSQFGNATFEIIQIDEKAIGRLYVDRRSEEIRIIDITIAPSSRNQGIGSQILKNIIKEASGKEIPVRIHVEKNNPALRLYLRMGFHSIEDKGVYLLMEYKKG